jgi:Zn-dependent membrane protease YugP
VMIAGLADGLMKLFLVGVALFSLVLAFQIVTLPVEFDASARPSASPSRWASSRRRSARASTRC